MTTILILLAWLLGVIGGLWSLHLYKKTLVMKANDKTAECINGEFYYIIKEKDYVDLQTHKHLK
jgi:hypothetical protein